jgi:hypothetical protein
MFCPLKQIYYRKQNRFTDIKTGVFMESETNKETEDQKEQAAKQLLEKLKEQLFSSNASVRRRAAFNLSWKQEDGLDILRSILLGDFPETAKNASAYGLRKMQGRMKKKALDVFKEGLRQRNSLTGEISRNALILLGYKIPKEYLPDKQTDKKIQINGISRKNQPRRTINSR